MKAKLKRVPNKLAKNEVTRAKLKKEGAISFTELSKIISTGATNVVVLDLTGKPVTVEADALGTRAGSRKKKHTEKLTKFERSLRRVMETHDIDSDEVTGVALILGEADGPPQKYYKPRTM